MKQLTDFQQNRRRRIFPRDFASLN